MTHIDDKEFEFKLRSEFLTEASELIQGIESDFLRLENESGDHALVDRVFRTIHTVKGSAAVAGFEQMAAYAHVFETLLGKIRNGELKATRESIDAMLAGVDMLACFITHLRPNHSANVDASESISRLQSFIDTAAGKAVSVTAPKAASAPAPETATMPEGKLKKILLVDDDEIILEYYKMILAPLNLELLSSRSGHEALESWSANRDLDLLVIDQTMPGMSGTEFLETVRRSAPEITAIVVSGFTRPEVMIKFINLGVVDYLTKPVEPEAFRARISAALKLAEYRGTLSSLSKLTIRSLLTFRKVEAQLEGIPDLACTPSVSRLSDLLQEMGGLVERLFELDKDIRKPKIDGVQ